MRKRRPLSAWAGLGAAYGLGWERPTPARAGRGGVGLGEAGRATQRKWDSLH